MKDVFSMRMYDITNQIPPCNYSASRDGYKPCAIALHITGDSMPHQATSWFKDKRSGVSAHYVIEKDGTAYICVYPQFKAYHCGIINHPTAKIYFDKGGVNPNLYTIGIECVSSGEQLTIYQFTSLQQLISDLCNAYSIPLDRYHIIGHNELDSINRHFDPIASYQVELVIPKVEKESDKMFKDVDKIAEYAKVAVDNLEKLGIVHGDTDGNFNPLENITRQDMAVIVNNLLKVKSL